MIILANKKVLKFQQLYAASHDTGEVARLAAEPVGNFRKTVGIVGASRIGRRVIELLRPFESMLNRQIAASATRISTASCGVR